MKQKTKKVAAKRIKVSSNKKLMRGHAYSSHLKRKKSKSRQRRQKEPTIVNKGFKRTVRRLLGI
jgi:large subunit ribosomal protein L35